MPSRIEGWDQLDAAVLEALRQAKNEVVARAYEDIVPRSPVKTGAYRTEHVIAEGDGAAVRAMIYEAPNRVGPDTKVPYTGTVLEPPNVGDARAALRAHRGDPFAPVTILNDRFYADRIENGSSMQAPQGVYGLAADAAERIDVDIAELRF